MRDAARRVMRSILRAYCSGPPGPLVCYSEVMLKLALAVVAVLIAFTVLVRLFEARLAYFPAAAETATPAASCVESQALPIATAAALRLPAWRLPPAAP